MNLLKRRWAKRLLWTSAVLLVLVLACAVYLGDYYPADMESVEAFAPTKTFEQYRNQRGDWILEPEDASVGFIFYPGGKVEHTAYLPLMEGLASEGILCVLTEMPFRLAVFDVDAAEGVPQQYPQVEHWYIGGHSLGGSMAASYLSNCAEQYDGLILLGAYSTADLSETGLSVLSVYGDRDLVRDSPKYEANKVNLPENYIETVIEGGCHACFGMYGAQKGDGIPTITNEEQIELTVKLILDMIGEPKQ